MTIVSNHVVKELAVTSKKHPLNAHEPFKEVGVCNDSCSMILKENFEKHLSARFVPCLLSNEQNMNQVRVSRCSMR